MAGEWDVVETKPVGEWDVVPSGEARTGMPLEPPPQPTKANYEGWDTVGVRNVPGGGPVLSKSGQPEPWYVRGPAPKVSAPEKPKDRNDRSMISRVTDFIPQPWGTMLEIGNVEIPKLLLSTGESIYHGTGDLLRRMQGPLTPEKMHGLNPDELTAFSTLMGFGAGDLPGVGGLKTSIPKPDKATEMATKRVAQDLKARGMTAEEVADELKAGRDKGKPLMLADVGENTRGLLGTVSRQPGEAKQAVTETMTARDEGAYTRSQQDITTGLGASPTTKQTHEGIKQHQQIISQPLYDAAYEGGSIAPLQHQFSEAFNKASKASVDATRDLAAANQDLTVAQGKLTQTGGNVYSENAARQQVRDAELSVKRAQRALNEAEAQKTQIHDMLRQSQTDAEMQKPGAVWTPYIQQVLEDPIVRSGIRRGLESQRLEGLAKRTTIDPTEYTIIGADEAGNPIVSKTPNMKTLDAVKRGMDHIIQSERQADGSLTQRGREIYLVREQFLKDVDGINPMYKKARSTWAGEAAADDALTTGKNFDKFRNPEDLADVVKAMSEPEKEFMRIGVANNLREKIGNLSVKGDEAKALLNTPFMKERLKAVFPTPEAAIDFIEKVGLERKMFETKLNTLGNSATANRMSEDINHSLEAGVRAAHAAGHAARGSYLSSLLSMWRSVRAYQLRPDPILNKKIADVLMDPTAVPAMTGESTRVPPHTVAGQMLGRNNVRPGQLTIQRGPNPSQVLDQLGGPP